MSTNDLERRIADFYATERPLRAPDRVLERAITIIESTPQRRALALAPWRSQALNTYWKVAIAAVAVVATVAIAATQLLPRDDVGGPPTSAPGVSPGASATASPTQAVRSMPGGNAPLAPGRYVLRVPGAPVRAELAISAPGWTGNDWYLTGPDGTSISFWTVANVYADACEESRLPDPPTGPSVDDLVAALDAQLSTDLEDRSSSTVGGYPASRFALEPSADLGQACLNADNMQLWVGPGGSQGRGIDTREPRGGVRDVVWVVGAGAQRIVIVAYYDPSVPASSAVDGVVSSITFQLP